MKFFLIMMLITVATNYANSSRALSSLKYNNVLISGGKSKSPGLITMIRAFWLTLINPENEESLKEEKGGLKKKKIFNKSSFISKKK